MFSPRLLCLCFILLLSVNTISICEATPVADAGVGGSAADCTLPSKVGRCRARIPRFYFNSDKKSCEMFFFGGCDSNGNNFNTLELCQQTCEDV